MIIAPEKWHTVRSEEGKSVYSAAITHPRKPLLDIFNIDVLMSFPYISVSIREAEI